MRQKKSKIFFILIIFLFVVLFIAISNGLAQTVVQWNLTSDASVTSIDNNLSANPVVLNNVVVSRFSTTSEPPPFSILYGMATAPSSDGRNWNAVFDETKYLQFSVTVKAGQKLSISSISFDIGSFGGTSLNVAIYYSTNSDFSNAIAVVPTSSPIDQSIFIVKNTMYPLTKNFSLSIENNQTVYFRIYSMYSTTGARWLLLRNFAVQGTISQLSPTIVVSDNAITGFSQSSGNPSESKTYTVSGLLLTSNITIQPPIGYQISLDNINWINNSESIILNQSGGIIINQPVTIYVRLNSSSTGSISGDIIHTSNGANTISINVQGLCSSIFYSAPSGDITNTSTWDSDPSGIGTNPPNNFTSDAQTFIITNRDVVNLTTNWVISGTGSKVIIGNGTNTTNFVIESSGKLTGRIDVAENGTLTLKNTNYPSFGDIHKLSTIVFDGMENFIIPAINYGNLISLNDFGAQRTLASGKIAIANTFSPGLATYTTTNNSIVFNGTNNQVVPPFTYNILEIDNNNCTTPDSKAKIIIGSSLVVKQRFIISASDTLVISNGATLTVEAAQTLVVNGTLDNYSKVALKLPGNLLISNNGNYIVHTNNGPVPSANATYASGSNLVIASCSDTASRIPSVGGNVIWNCPMQTAGLINNNVVTGSPVFLGTSSGTYSIGGNLIIISTGAGCINIGSGTTYRTLNIGGDLIIQGGEFDVAGYHASNPTNQTVNVNGNVIVSGGKLFVSANVKSGTLANLNVKGNVIHSGGEFGNTTNSVSGILTFSGNSDQNFATTGLSDALSIVVNKQSNIILANNLNLSGSFTLSSGNIVLKEYNLTASSISGGSASSYIVTDSTGMLRRGVGASNVLFPIGLPSSYNPVIINNSGTADIFGARVQSKIESGIKDTNRIIKRQWVITESIIGGSNASINFQWNESEAANGFTLSNNISVGRDSASNWLPYSATVSGTGPFNAIITGVRSFSNFVVGNDSAFTTGGVSVKHNYDVIAKEFNLRNNYPNPFNPSTTIEFTLAEKSRVSIIIFDLLGREVANLFEGEKEAGIVHRIKFEASHLPSGIYYCRLNAGSFSSVKKMMLLK